MFPTEIRSDLEDTTMIQMNNRLNRSLHVSNLHMETNMNNNAFVYINIRPQTADIIYDTIRAESPIRPVTADGTSRSLKKSVHFGDDPFKKFTRTPTSKTQKDINNTRISEQVNSTNSSSLNTSKQEIKKRIMKKDGNNSCKPEEKEEMGDNGDDGSGGGPAPGTFNAQGTSSASVTARYTNTSQKQSNKTQNTNQNNSGNNQRDAGQEPPTEKTSTVILLLLYLFVMVKNRDLFTTSYSYRDDTFTIESENGNNLVHLGQLSKVAHHKDETNGPTLEQDNQIFGEMDTEINNCLLAACLRSNTARNVWSSICQDIWRPDPFTVQYYIEH